MIVKGRTLIIAEAGVNHNGSIALAKELVDAAADSGADYVKFQTFKAEKLVTRRASKASYQSKNTTLGNDSQLEMLRNLELSYDDFLELSAYCIKKGVGFLSTPFDLDSIDFLDSLIPFFKVPSGEITNYPYLKKIAQKGKPVILSTGMCTVADIENALSALESNGVARKEISVLHCNTEYPTPMVDVNLLAMLSIKKDFNVNVGYSDHTLGIEIPIAAVALGAQIVEKHFTLDKTMEGPDHKASLNPRELKEMVTAIRNIEVALGSGNKVPSDSELQNIMIARKSIVASKFIKKGELFSNENLTTKRPGNGISPMSWEQIIGKVSKKNYELDDLIEEDDLNE
jgi:N,N'-diacetyllegionaminate synthase